MEKSTKADNSGQNSVKDKYVSPSEVVHIHAANKKALLINEMRSRNASRAYDNAYQRGHEPWYTQISREVMSLKSTINEGHKKLLIAVLKKDAEEEKRLLRLIGKDFINTQP